MPRPERFSIHSLFGLTLLLGALAARSHGEEVLVGVPPVPIFEIRFGAGVVETPFGNMPERLADRLNTYEARLDWYFVLRQDWIAAQLGMDEPSRARLRPGEEVIHKALVNYAGYTPALQPNVIWHDDLPLRFALPGRHAWDAQPILDEDWNAKFLPADQRQLVAKALDARRVRQRLNNREFVIALLDQELCLSETQRASLRQAWPQEGLADPFYLLPSEGNSTFRSRIAPELAAPLRKLLSPPQLAIYDLLEIFSGPMTTVENEDQLHSWLEDQQDQLRTVQSVRMKLRLEELAAAGTPAAELARLRTAAKGVAETVSRRIVADSAVHFLQVAHLNGINRQTSYQLPAVLAESFAERIVPSVPFWQEGYAAACRSIGQNPEQARQDRLAAARANLAADFLDMELWLTSEQRAALLPHIERVPAGNEAAPRGLREMSWLAGVLHRIPEAEWRKVLSPRQSLVWRMLRIYFEADAESRLCRVDLANGERATIRLPAPDVPASAP